MLNVSNVDWNGKDHWNSLIDFINCTESSIYNTTDENGNLIVVYVQQGKGCKRVDWHNHIATIHEYHIQENNCISIIERFEYEELE